MPEENVQQPVTVASFVESYNKDMLRGNEPPATTQETAPVADAPAGEPQTTAPEQAASAPATEDWFDSVRDKFNSEFGTEVKSKDEIKEKIRSLTENQEYLNKKEYYSEIEKVMADMQEHLDPVKRFKTKENYEKVMTASILSEQIPEALASLVVSTDFAKADNLEAIYMEAITRDPNLLSYASEQDIKKGLLSRLGVDVADPEFKVEDYMAAAKLNPSAIVALSAGGTQAKSYFKGLLDEARKGIPEIKDWKQEIETRAQERVASTQKRTEEWTMKAKELSDQFKEFSYVDTDANGKEEVFKFTVPKEFRDKLAPYLVNYAVSSGFDVTPDKVAALQAEIQDAFEEQYKVEIRKDYRKSIESKLKEEFDLKVHNPKPISTQEAPPDHASSYLEEANAQRDMYGLPKK